MRRAILLSFLAAAAAGCDDERCLVFDYGPPSIRFTLTDADTGDDLCGLAVTAADERQIIPHVEQCTYEIPGWWDPELGQSVTLIATGYEETTVQLPAPETNDCGEILAPEPVSFEMTPAP